MSGWAGKRDMMDNEPPYLAVGTEVSAKYKGAFCEAKIRKVVRSVKCKVMFKHGLGSATVADDQIKGLLRNGATVEVRHSEKKENVEATITKIQDCSQYTVVFDDGDITTLRRTALCLKSGRHFAESETLDQLPLTHPEHFGTPVIGGRRGRRNRSGMEGSSDDDESMIQGPELSIQKEEDIGRVVCVEGSEKRKQKDNWFPGLVVAPTAQDTVEIHVKDEYLVRSFKDGRYYTVPKNEATEFTREIGAKVDSHTLKTAVDKALLFLDRGELPPHWDRELLLYGLNDTASDSEQGDCESSDDEPREEKDHFVAQLYKFMDDSGTPINKGPTIGAKDVDLYRLFKVVQNLGGYNRVSNTNNWKTISHKIGFGHNPVTVSLVKQSYKKFLYSFEEFYRKLGCTMINHPRLSRNRCRSGRSLIRDRDRAPILVKSEPIEEKNKPSTSSVIPVLPVMCIKPDPDAPVDPAPQPPPPPPPPEQPKTYPTLKEKLLQKKSTPIELPIPVLKIKEEKKEAEAKVEAKEIKKDKLRMIKTKTNEPEPGCSKESSKDKKKKILLRLAGGTKKDSSKISKAQMPAKVPTPGLANTRQKRTMKERANSIFDQYKPKGQKYSSSTSSTENEKVKTKAKDESNTNTATKIIQEENLSSTDEKKKGRKRKERGDPIDEHFDVSPSHKVVSIGDKLRVCYGPTHESKVTYEAKESYTSESYSAISHKNGDETELQDTFQYEKERHCRSAQVISCVLNVREEEGENLYLVHYNGWNSRYDEWIKMSRIAHNYSWTGGRSPKKASQAQTTISKSSKKKLQKGDTSSTQTSKEASYGSQEKIKDQGSHSRQASVGRSTTPSSISSLSNRKYANTRAFTRSTSNKRELSASETEHEYESDSAETGAGDGSKTHDTKFEKTTMVKRRKKRKGDDDTKSKSSKIKQESKDDAAPVKSRRLRKSSFDKSSEKDKESDNLTKVSIKTEAKSEDDDEDEDEQLPLFDASYLRKYKESSMSSLIDGPFDDMWTNEEKRLNDENKPLSLFPSTCPRLTKESSTYDDLHFSKGRDIDLGLIRSELKGIVKGLEMQKNIAATSNQTNNEASKEDSLKEEDKDAEDIYEFKEPEPFEFEVRKSLEDKGKLSRRNLSGRLFDEKNMSKSSSTSPARAKSPINSPNVSPRKEDSNVETTSTIQTCEEAFDKICASPLRAATESRSHIHLQLYGVPEESYDEFDDDSQDRLVISERENDNVSNQEINAQENRPSENQHHESESRENFPNEDEDMEDDAINVAIQRAIQESSDDTNDGEFMGRSLPTKVITHCIENAFDSNVLHTSKCLPPSPTHLESIGMSTEVETVKTYIPHNEDAQSEENSEDKKEVIYQDEIVEIREVSANYCDEDIIVEEDAQELEVEVEEDQEMMIVEEQTIEEDSSEVFIEERLTSHIPSESVVTETIPISVIQISSKDVEEEDESEENNLNSLICEETIPRSPTPQTEAQGEEELSHPDDAVSNETKVEQRNNESSDLVKPTAAAIDNTPPHTPESSMSSLASPHGIEISPPHLGNEKTSAPAPITIKAEIPVLPKPASDARAKKTETSRSAGKKGRRPRKRSEETSKRKNPRSGRHHGSDSDEVVDSGTANNSRRENRSSPRPNRYNFSLTLTPDIGYPQKISMLMQTLNEIRKTHADVKTELAMIDRRRKKLRRRERENAAAVAAASAAAAAAIAGSSSPAVNPPGKVH